MSEVGTFLMRHMRRAIEKGRLGLSIPPILLVGPPGDGKTTYARLIAELAGTPFRQIDVGSGSAGFRITGLERGWSSAQSGVPVEMMSPGLHVRRASASRNTHGWPRRSVRRRGFRS